jgi:DNA repair photolyase
MKKAGPGSRGVNSITPKSTSNPIQGQPETGEPLRDVSPILAADAMYSQNVELLPLDSIHPSAGNVRTHSPDQIAALAKGIKAFGFIGTVLIDAQNNIIAGHGRHEAAKEAGLKDIPCMRVTHLSPEQVRAFMIADNKLTEMGGWDNARLATEMADLVPSLKALDINMTDMGFSQKDISLLGHMLGDAAPPEFADQSGEGSVGEEYAANTDQQTENVSCSISQSASDIGTGPCPHRCVYCFVKNSKAGASQRQFKPAKLDSISAVIERAKEFGFVTIGNTSDPLIKVFKKQLHHLFAEATRAGVTLEMQTKDPEALLAEVQETGFNTALLSVKSSFSFFDDDRGAVAEPGCKPPSTRVAAMAELKRLGAEISFRWQPIYLGYDLDFEKSLDIAVPDLVFVEPLRVGATTRAHNERIAPCLTDDKQDFVTWLKRWYQTDSDGNLVMVNAMHYYTLRRDEARAEYLKYKAMVKARGAKFSICSCDNSLFALDILEGPGWACSTPRRIAAGWKHDPGAIHSRGPEGRLSEIIPRSFIGAPQEVIDIELARMSMLTDPTMNVPLDKLI